MGASVACSVPLANAPATGQALAELIAEGAATAVDLRPFDSGRLPAVWIG
jgi:glycine/D-amino acid oxidase-like deaminating enzyme